MREMKNSGFEWIEDMPNDWCLERLQWHIEEINISNNPIQTKEVLSLTNKLGVIPYEEKGNQGNKAKENVYEYKLAFPNTIVANSMNILIGSVGLCNYFGCVSPVYYVFKAKKGNNIRFLNYIFQTTGFQRELRKFANGILEIRLRVSANDILKRFVPFPSESEQHRIADFLDRECGKINSIAADIEKQIEILEQYKRSVIQTAVSRGLDYSVALGESKVKYVGSIPHHWEVKRGKYIFSYIQKPVKENDGVITCFRDGEVTLRSNRREEGFTVSEKEIGYQGIDVGDLIVHGMDGFAGAIGISDSRGKASPVLNNLMTTHCKKYYMYYLRNMAYRGVFISLSTGIRVRTCDTNWGKLREIYYAVPPLEEQQAIADYLDKKCAEIDVVIADKKEQLDILENYKKSIIYEYVTGKKEVM